MKSKRVLLIIFIVIALSVASVFLFFRGDGLLYVYFLDIGQGDAVYVKSPSGHDMLIDASPGKIILERLAGVMPWYDREIDFVVETHPDIDHIGGMPMVLERYRVNYFLEPGIDSKNSIDNEIHKILKEKNIPDILARRGMDIDLGGGVIFHILYPDKDVSGLKNTNEASIVGQIKYGSTTIMLTGDSPKKIENYLIKIDGDNLKSDVLKAGHHGSRTSSGENFVKMVSPEYVVISAGKKNRYGHPNIEVLKIFEKLDIKILQTSMLGTVEFISDGLSFIENKRRQ